MRIVRTAALLALLVGCALGSATPAAADDHRYLTYKLGLLDNPVTKVRTSFSVCGGYWLVNQEVHWGAITATSAYIKFIKFNYWVTSYNTVRGGGWAAYNSNGYSGNSTGDMSAQYKRTASSSYAGSYTVTVNKKFVGGATNGRLIVNVDKHSQWVSYTLGSDCHGVLTVTYYT